MPADKRPVGTLVDLDVLVPKDIGFRFQGVTYRVPGDLAIDRTIELFELFAKMLTAQTEPVAAGKGKTKSKPVQASNAVKDLEAYVLDLFRIRQLDLKELPFGTSGLFHVVRAILQELGAISAEAEGGGSGAMDGGGPVPLAKRPRKASSRSRSSKSSRK